MKGYRRLLPSMSRTEREALEAGTVWWDGELFTAIPTGASCARWQPPDSRPRNRRSSMGPAKSCAGCWMILISPPARRPATRGVGVPQESRLLRDDHPQAVWRPAVFRLRAQLRAGEALWSQCHCASTVAVPNSLGPAELLVHYGTEAQKDHYLPRLARGEDVRALRSPVAGRLGRGGHPGHGHRLPRSCRASRSLA